MNHNRISLCNTSSAPFLAAPIASGGEKGCGVDCIQESLGDCLVQKSLHAVNDFARL